MTEAIDTQSRDELLRAADEARAKLVGTIVRLDERRHEAFDVRKQVGRYLKQFRVAEGLIALSVGVVAIVTAQRLAARPRRLNADRWRLLKALWMHPDRELRAERAPFVAEVGRSLLLTVVTSALAIPLRKAVQRTAG